MPSHAKFLCILLPLAITTATLVGCAHWNDSPIQRTGEATAGAPLPENPQRAVLQVDFVNASLENMDTDQLTGLWQWVEETALDTALRQKLLDNGLRVGLVSNHERFQSKLQGITIEPNAVDTFLSEASVASEVSHGKQRIPMRLGRRYELPLRQPLEGSHVALIQLGDERIGRTLDNAQYFLVLTASESTNAQQVRLRVRPEIQHGAARQKWVSSDTAIRIDTRRETWSLDSLDIQFDAPVGSTIVIAPDSPIRGLASKMLSGSGTDQHEEQLVILIHVAQVPSPSGLSVGSYR